MNVYVCCHCSYRDAGEVQGVRKERDPITLLTAYALNGNLVTEEELKVSIPSLLETILQTNRMKGSTQ